MDVSHDIYRSVDVYIYHMMNISHYLYIYIYIYIYQLKFNIYQLIFIYVSCNRIRSSFKIGTNYMYMFVPV